VQTPLRQAVPIIVQVLLPQQGSPRLPQTAQTLLMHVVPPAVQPPFMQHGCPWPPQVPQLPFMQVPPLHAIPAATHMLATQHPPLLQVLAAQQTCPAAPQLLPCDRSPFWFIEPSPGFVPNRSTPARSPIVTADISLLPLSSVLSPQPAAKSRSAGRRDVLRVVM
jgi:hypothetical protein